jgi:ABC-type transport system substrate-binding protein
MIGTTLADRYQITGELGRGGMGVVYKALDPLLRREVAIKMIPPALLDEKAARRFEQEAQLVAQLDHPALLPIHDLGRFKNGVFLVMPLVQGETLQTLIRGGRLRLAEILEIGAQVARGLAFAHGRGVVHRDVKPSNIMVSRVGDEVRARLMDFGLALDLTETSGSRVAALAGTVAYLPPEQLQEKPVRFEKRGDLYALGAALYECLAGQPPFEGPLYQTIYRALNEKPAALSGLRSDLPSEVENWIMRCLEKMPERRPQSGEELAQALEACRIELHNVDALRPERPLLELQEQSELQLVGRAREVALLEARLESARAGQSQLVLIAGEAGVGKSRLLRELEAACRARQILVLRGRFSDWESAFPFQGLGDLILDFYRHRDSTSAPQSAPDLTDLAPELIAIFPMLAEIPQLRSLEAPRPPYERPRRDPAALFELMARTLQRLMGSQTLVLLLENVHAGTNSLEPLAYLTRRLSATPLLIVATYRPAELLRNPTLRRLLESFAEDPRFASINLPNLNLLETRRLIELVLGESALAVDLVEQVFEATAGNPLFTIELLKSLRGAGLLEPDELGCLTLTDEAGPMNEALPATLQQAEERRLEGLTERQREILTVAAVLGRSFDLEELEDVLGLGAAGQGSGLSELELESDLAELLTTGVLHEDKKARGDRFGFASVVLRDLLYESLSRRRRRALHRDFVTCLERRYAGRLERVYPQLVHHGHAADLAEKTIHYSLLFAEQTLTLSPQDALRALRNALDLVEEEEVAEGAMIKARLIELRARAEAALGQVERALRSFESAFEQKSTLNAAPADRAALALAAAELAWQARRTEMVRPWVDRGLVPARAAGDREGLRRLLSLACTVANLRGETIDAFQAAELRQLEAAPARIEEQATPGGRLICALAATYRTHDPALFSTIEEWEIAANIFEPLLVSDADGVLGAGLATLWQGLDDFRALRLKLRPAVFFSNGTPLDAAGVKASFERSIGLESTLSPFFAALVGHEEFRKGRADSVAGILLDSEDSTALTFSLRESLPIAPALLTDLRTAIVHVAASGELVGTGPFAQAPGGEQVAGSLLLERNRFWRGKPAQIDQLEFRFFADAAERARKLEIGEVDLAHDLRADDLERLLREADFRQGLVETTKKNVYFALFNPQGPLTRSGAVRRALCRSVRLTDLIWKTLGRFAIPAVGLIPPGIAGHDAGRRRPLLAPEDARELVATAAEGVPLVLRAVIHPLFRDRFFELFEALRQEWSSLGLEVEVVIDTIQEYLDAWQRGGPGVDVLILRWAAAYEDPDNFTYNLFHGDTGLMRHLFSSSSGDELLVKARRETRSAVRQALYQRFEDLILEENVILPLFHEIDYRLAGPSWRGLALRNTPPYLNYGELWQEKSGEALSAGETREASGELHVPTTLLLVTLDPIVGHSVQHHEIVSNIFETLTRCDREAQIRPWLAEAFEVLDGGRTIRFRLRSGLRFHDGRFLTARDVRFSFERFLTHGNPELRFLLLPIAGARALANGETTTLRGLTIISPRDFTLELHRPLSFFPALLSHPAVAIVPEETTRLAGPWRDGCCGTGPFRVVAFEPGQRLDLERHPFYWREGRPKSKALSFHRMSSSEEIVRAFQNGHLTIASDLLPADLERLRQHPERWQVIESPSLSTYYLALNSRRGLLENSELRSRLADALEIGDLVRDVLGRKVMRAQGIIPPGLLGHEQKGVSARKKAEPPSPALAGLRLRLAAHPVFSGPYGDFREALVTRIARLGIDLEVAHCSVLDLTRAGRSGDYDLLLSRWVAVYPDTDGFMLSLLDLQEGVLSGMCGSIELDRMIEKARLEPDPALRHAIYRRVEELIAEQNLLLPIFHAPSYRVAQKNVRGLHLSITAPEIGYDELYLESEA